MRNQGPNNSWQKKYITKEIIRNIVPYSECFTDEKLNSTQKIKKTGFLVFKKFDKVLAYFLIDNLFYVL